MNQQHVESSANIVLARACYGASPVCECEAALRSMGAWLDEGVRAVRERPVVWLAIILSSADLATVLEHFTPLGILATVLVPAVTGAMVLRWERGHAMRRTLSRTRLRPALHTWPVAVCYAVWTIAGLSVVAVAPVLVRGLLVTPLMSAFVLLSMHGSARDRRARLFRTRSGPSVVRSGW